MIKSPVFFFPTRIAFIDDDQLYAKLFIETLTEDYQIDVLESADHLLNQKNADFIFIDNKPKDIINSLTQSIEEQKNSLENLISVVIADFHMDEINGIELFRQMDSPFIFKILISNFIDERFLCDVHDAQNSGVIHAVLQKGNSLKEVLTNTIAKGQQVFFTKLGNHFYQNSTPPNYLTDTQFSNQFIKLIDEEKPSCIWPEKHASSFIFEYPLSKKKKKFYIMSKDEINTLLEGEYSKSAPEKTIELLKSGEFIICHINPHMLEGTEWPYYMRPAKSIAGIHKEYLYHTMEL